MKKLNLFLIALMCASLCFIGCKDPAGSSGETPLDLSKPLGDWVVGTWDNAETINITTKVGNSEPETIKKESTGTVMFDGKEPKDACVLTYDGQEDYSIITVQQYFDFVSRETIKKEIEDQGMILKEYTLTINSSNDVITCVVKADGTRPGDDTIFYSVSILLKLTKRK